MAKPFLFVKYGNRILQTDLNIFRFLQTDLNLSLDRKRLRFFCRYCPSNTHDSTDIFDIFYIKISWLTYSVFLYMQSVHIINIYICFEMAECFELFDIKSRIITSVDTLPLDVDLGHLLEISAEAYSAALDDVQTHRFDSRDTT